ncbi:MAG: hypothetical protein ACODAB_04015 [Gemmatimonadota bacterium]
MKSRSAITATSLIVAILSSVPALQAQSLQTGLVLAGSGVDEPSARPTPDVSPPPRLERMSVGDALQGHLVGWMEGEELGVVTGARVRGYDVSNRPVPLGRVLERPESFVVNGVFPSPREGRLENALFLVLASTGTSDGRVRW